MRKQDHPAKFRCAWARLVILPLCALAAQAQADGTWDNCVRSPTTSYHHYLATTIHLRNDAAVGDLVGPWITTSPTLAWRCTRKKRAQGTTVQVSTQGYPPYPRFGAIHHDGETYSWYRPLARHH